MNKCFLLIIMFKLFSPLLFSQADSLLVTRDYNGVSVKTFINIIEQGHKCHFYFKEGQFDTLSIKQEQTPSYLSQIMKTTFSGTNFYLYYDENNVLITKGARIRKKVFEDLIIRKKEPEEENVEPEEEVKKKVKEPKYSIIVIGDNTDKKNGQHATLSGFVKDEETGDPVIGAVVYAEEINKGTTTDLNGYYVITLPKGQHIITFQSLGYKNESKRLIIKSDGSLNLNLKETITELKGVVIKSNKYQNVTGLQVGMQKMDMKTIKQIPTSMGEADILKTALLLPGVKSVGEGASGFNVRGGSTDQNLILINDAPVYNSSHFFGFFSTFNQDLIRFFELYKSGIPARYGGRISSVMDIKMKTGNKKQFAGQGGISPVTGRLTVEGPIIKEKLSYIVGVRSTYSDWILRELNDPGLRNSSAAFRDVGGKISGQINKKNTIDFTGYYSYDFFEFKSDTTYKYNNNNFSLVWKHIFSNKLFADFTAIQSNYAYNINSNERKDMAYDMIYGINYKALKSDFSYFPENKHKLKFGLHSSFYNLAPGELTPAHDSSLIKPIRLKDENANESALYFSDEIDLSSRLLIYAGIRYSFFANFGPSSVYQYQQDQPLEVNGIIDTNYYRSGELIKTYHGPEFRFSLRYKLNEQNSVKISYNRMRQYLHMLSNTTAISPTDIWKLSNMYIKPQIGDQYAIGYYKDFTSKNIETSLEVYYKDINDIIEYKPGAKLLLNETIETDLLNAYGRAYGIECMIKKNYGKLNGWISYTYSRIKVKADSKHPEEKINNGNFFPANYDQPHDVTLVFNYKFNRRLSFSSNYTYSTGRPITYPATKYNLRGTTLLHYSERNEYRIPYYSRLDLSVNVDGNLKANKLFHSSWSLSVYNVLGRSNVYSIFFEARDKTTRGYKLSVFAQPIVTLTYNFKF